MKTDFDFDRPGKRMPYTVPDGFFEQMEEDILRELDRRETAVQKSRRFLRLALGAVTTAAAAIAVVFLLDKAPESIPSAEFAEVERAFDDLSTEDRTYLLSVYRDDLFINP